MSLNQSIGDPKYLKKRIPQNPKYQHVKSRLDTGLSLTKYMERLEEIKRNCRYKKGELFKRLKVTTFAQLVLQVASVSDLNESITDEVPGHKDVVPGTAQGDHLSDQIDGSPLPNSEPHKLSDGTEPSDTAFSPRSTLQSVISGVGELDLDKDGLRDVTLTPLRAPCAVQCPYPDCPYLLLDVRDRDLYDQCHIISAHSYPITTLSRTMNPYTKEVLDYRNAEGKIIILYDEDERIASQAAATMCERGFENLFMLSGGLKVIAQKFPEGMSTGLFPVTCLPTLRGPSGQKHAAFPQTQQPAEDKQRFTSEDLDKIQHYLQEVFLSSEGSSRLSSRMSTSSAYSKLSSARSSRLSLGSARSQSSRPWK
ncbi:centrosomal protein of 41 kDa [Neoarius graeffei]|uniref:centrosomal protein of 41 kDa n=1 Tax=Neoarius graeffei TaxID=443677 RepID=UPI00298C0C8C|nr:centrosomal protein of 41 kDa [Neoarius graeffei]